ncbi:MAG: hypothetical protein LJE85_15610 [Gammaproteobacteria bacterium]|nr:hypothetical protein [Gammaproteobacteria bacterium]
MMLQLLNKTKNIVLFLTEEFADGMSLHRGALKKGSHEQFLDTEQTLASEAVPVLKFD